MQYLIRYKWQRSPYNIRYVSKIYHQPDWSSSLCKKEGKKFSFIESLSFIKQHLNYYKSQIDSYSIEIYE